MELRDTWIRDTGIVFALVCIVLGREGNLYFLSVSAAFLLAVLFMPSVLRPFAWGWLALAEALGFVMNKVFFGAVFFLVLVPVGVLKRVVEGDERNLVAQPDVQSAFIHRDRVVVGSDMEKPF